MVIPIYTIGGFMNLLSWFKKDEKIDIPTASSIELKPSVQLDEETRLKLYEDAVKEVHHARLKELILTELTVLASYDLKRSRQAQQLRDTYGYDYSSRFSSDERDKISELYPDLVIREIYERTDEGHTAPIGLYSIVKPSVSIDNLANNLASQYLSE